MHVMRPAKHLFAGLLVAAAASGGTTAVGDRVRDAAARVDYGWYTNDPALIMAARDAVGREPGDPWAPYVSAYASYRAAELERAAGRSAVAELGDCEEAADSAAKSEAAEAEASVLIAACAGMAAAEEPLRGVLHLRRSRQALARARALAPDNPRLALVTYRLARDRADAPAPAIEAVVEAFRSAHGSLGFPDWGEAEALTEAGRVRLAAGDRRGARDLVEQALLIAPDYTAARALQRAVIGR